MTGLKQLIFYTYLACSETVKILQTATCSCIGGSQPFNAWFYPAFHHQPYAFWWTYHGITWLAGPYSLAWWMLNSPAYFGYWTFNIYLLLLDLCLIVTLRKHRGWTLFYATVSIWFIGAGPDPVDFFIVTAIFLGRFHRSLLIVAPLLKLPLGAPLWVWQWVFESSNSLRGPENFGRYLLLATLWLVSLTVYFADRKEFANRFFERVVFPRISRAATPA